MNISVTLIVTPAAASSSSASSPAAVAGTLIMRFLCPADHCLPSSMYRLTRSACGSACGLVLDQRVQLEADVPVVSLGSAPTTGRNTCWADLTSSSSSAQAIASSLRPCPISSPIRPSKCPLPDDLRDDGRV